MSGLSKVVDFFSFEKTVEKGEAARARNEAEKKAMEESFYSHVEGETQREGSGTWRNTGYYATDEEAHRNVRYSIRSSANQTLTVFMAQMKLFAKMKWTYILLFMALLIPIIALGVPGFVNFLTNFGFSEAYSNTRIAGLLFFLPLMLGLVTSVMCGKQMPTEFKDRTAYLNIPLPMSRASFYFGKYLAGFVMCVGVFMFAYSMAIITVITKYDTIFADLILESLLLTVIGILAYSATAYCLGCFTKKGSSILPFAVMSFIIPFAAMIICTQFNDYTLTLLPFFLGEAALGILGAPMSGSVGMIAIAFMDLSSVWTMIAVGIAWAIAMLAIGYYRISRREM
ncbi:MAG: ABC transporter permease [Candidatus Methanomethylophilaceae archaeon]|nr:ABC transporter permease [Candidatus Methanomethylophilaceae archaeon]